MGKSGRVNRVEPSDTGYVDAHAKNWFQKARLYKFLQKFTGENYGVARAFTESFGGKQVKIGTLKFSVTKAFISKAIGLPMSGESWFKGKTLVGGNLVSFPKLEYKDVDWKSGIPAIWLKDEWK